MGATPNDDHPDKWERSDFIFALVVIALFVFAIIAGT